MSKASTVQAITFVGRNYFDGMQRGEPALLEKCFHKDAYFMDFYHGEYMRETAAEWIEVVRKSPKPVESGTTCNMEITSIGVSRPTALAKVKVMLEGLMCTDYLTFVQMPEELQIVHKTNHHS
jgi:protease I